MSLSNIVLPARMEQALATWDFLQSQQIYFAPVRHHSPACAYGLLSLIDDIQPDHILIEAPVSFNHLLPDLLHPDAKPPIAVMGQADFQARESQEGETPQATTRSAFFPFCDYSPEWVALHAGHRHNATLRFIDLPWVEQIAIEERQNDVSQSLQAERYLAHSQFISALAKKCYCRDHDDLWEHLFELRSIEALADWQSLFRDTLVWCALARLDYEPQVLEAEGSAQREAHMLAAIMQVRAEHPTGKILVVTGGFHSLALLEGLSHDAKSFNVFTDAAKKLYQKQLKQAENDSAWLIRYSFDRLDALNGYASGMPAPAYYQRSWQMLMAQRGDRLAETGRALTTQEHRNNMGMRFLSEVASLLRAKSFDDPPSYITVKNAVEQSVRLAALRGHEGPGRYDLLDGLQSSFIKGSIDDAQSDLWLEIKKAFSGHALGQIPAGSATPPLVAETYRLAKYHRFKLDDTLVKLSRLDIYRNPQHRARSRFLHLLSFLEVGFATRSNGPDFLSGHNLDLLFEEWHYAWTPSIEGRLITLSEKGSQLEAIAIDKLLYLEKQLEEQGQNRSSKNAVRVLIQAALLGLPSRVAGLFRLLHDDIHNDFRLSSLVECGHSLIHLWRGRDFLGLRNQPELTQLLFKLVPQTLFCLPTITAGDESQQEEHFTALLALRELIEFMPTLDPSSTASRDFYHQLQQIAPALKDVPLLKGAVDALRYLGDEIDEQTLDDNLSNVFSQGSDPEQAVRYFVGLMRAAPELIIKTPRLVDELNALMSQWDDDRFLHVLPDLRFAFSQLTPKQNATLANYIAEQCGFSEPEMHLWQTDFTEQEMLQTMQLNQKLKQQLAENDLLSWYEKEKGAAR
ncbi:4-aminobutyrate aminotransferase [Pectobacterium carotovorum]|uniref:DUF5682 family protein n=1 Tax=Pectobacterium carotovorum TaxID=554 RepID=UPI00191F2FAB|nr:DUF5682 family protein [Pectobacterium carotovorum]MBL0866803.1 4-aminobutyrate aminotransferase [Pectobacterium carotovorum]